MKDIGEEYEEYEIYCEFKEEPYAKCKVLKHPTEDELLQAYI